MHNGGQARHRNCMACCNAAYTEENIYIVAIGWLFTTSLMALTQPSVLSGLATFIFVSLLPCALILYLGGSKARKQRRRYLEQRAAREAGRKEN